MARRRGVVPRGFVRPAPRSNVWLFQTVAIQVVAGNTLAFLTSLNAAADALRPFTVVRTRLTMLVESDQSGASEISRGAMGMIVVKDQASAIGATALPAPGTNTNAEWFVYEPFLHSFEFITGVGFQSRVGTRIDVDSKAMRKVAQNEDVVMMFENLAGSGSRVSVQGRMLVKLH